MRTKISKTNSDLAPLFARLDEIRMSDDERLRAKASLARADAFADGVIAIVNLFKRLLKASAVPPAGRPTNQAG